jgi:hypothetical protein
LACNQLTYSGVDGSTWARVRDLISREYGIPIESDSGEASKRGFTFEWTYDASEQRLHVQCSQKPFLVPCGSVNKRIKETAAKCGIAPD